MNADPWLVALLLLWALMFGAFCATALWWWLAPYPLLARWNAPMSRALEAGFVDQALQHRLRTQADGVWIRRQQAQWLLAQEKLQSRQEARLLAQVSVLLRTRAKPPPLETVLTDAQLDALPPELSDLVGIGVPRPRVLAVPRKPPMTSI